jgi:hypothetical protein
MTLSISVVSHAHDPQPFPDVHYVQTVLKRKGLYPYTVDGVFGDHSRAGVVKFQTLCGIVRDGIVGPDTYKRLAASDPTRTAVTEAVKAADLMYRLVTTGIDGTRPAYVFGAEVSMYDKSPDRLDCSEAVQWTVTQVDGNTWIDGSANQYRACRHISVAQAVKTKGALLFSTSNGYASGIHHVAMSMGDGKTAEARSSSRGCGSWSATDGRFQLAGLVPVLRYS